MVVIVDDDDLIRGSLGGLMKEAGLPALTFASAEEIPNLWRREANGMCNRGYSQGGEKLRLQALRAGAVEFLTKPFDDRALLDSVRAALET